MVIKKYQHIKPLKSKGRRQAFLEAESQRLDIIAGVFGGAMALLSLWVLVVVLLK